MVSKIVTSKHLRTSTELTLVAPIEARFVRNEANDTISVATRLGAVLETFFAMRRASVERAMDGVVGPLERMRTLYNFSWSVFDEGSKLLLAVNFDRPWEPYIRSIVDLAGPFLDVIFCHCEGYAESSTEHGYVEFARWVRRRQIDVSLFYAAEPDLTVDDQRYLRELERMHRHFGAQPRFEQGVARLTLGPAGADRVPPPSELEGQPPALVPERDLADRRLVRAASALTQLRQMFAVHSNDKDPQASQRERRYFDRAAWLLLAPIAGAVDALERLPKELRDTLLSMRDVDAESRKQGASRSAPTAGKAKVALADLDKSVQANILTSYSHMTHGCMLLIGFDSEQAGREFVGRMANEVTPHAHVSAKEIKVNVALSYEGFRTLGLTQAELDGFPLEFREGMAARAGLLGDVGPEHPENWAGPARAGAGAQPPRVALAEVDLLLTVQGDFVTGELEWNDAHPLYAAVQGLLAGAKGVRVLAVEPLRREFMSKDSGLSSSSVIKERFGFADGISQPVAGLCAQGQPPRDQVALGELLVGHPSDRGEGEHYPSGPEAYTQDGSYLVVRKLEQDVEAFEAFIEENASQFGGGRDELYTKLMGRRRDGTSPVSRATLNDFDYSSDPAGDRCPLGSHVRRANPRTPTGESVHGRPLRIPRLARRGFSFGPFPGSEQRGSCGLMFMAYNASIAEQFEVIQRWLNGANSTGVLSDQADPVLSHRKGHVMTLLDGREPRYLVKKQPFVKLLWGHYFFAPSRGALRRLSSLQTLQHRAQQDAAALAEKGEAIIARMARLERAEQVHGSSSSAEPNDGAASLTDELKSAGSHFGWKLLLEDRGARAQARAVWAAIRDRHAGVLRTSYGVLVGEENAVRQVLGDEQHFSVCEYGRRMTESVGLLYLGMDRCPVASSRSETKGEPAASRSQSYEAAARLPNQFMYGLSRQAGYELAREVAGEHFEALEPVVDLVEFAKRVVTDVSRRWFGLPRRRAQYDIFHSAALSIFYPSPEPGVTGAAIQACTSGELEGAKKAALEDRGEREPELARFLRRHDFGGPEAIGMALVGGAQGTLAATTGSFLSVAHHGLESERFARWASWLLGRAKKDWLSALSAPGGGGEEPWLVLEVLKAMSEQPAPDILHRRAVAATVIADLEVHAGETVVVSLGSATAGGVEAVKPRELLFGGAYPSTAKGPQHPCPGREAALGVILGMLVTVLERDVRREGPLRVSKRSWDTAAP
jgi:Dyp-type peroxidase family